MYLTAKEFGQRPSYYAFGEKVQITSQYEIDFAVMCIGREYEAELLEEQRRQSDAKV